MIENIVILSIPKISQHILGVLHNKTISSLLHELFEVQAVNELIFSTLNSEVGLIWLFLLILLFLRLEGILRKRQHVFRNRQNVLNRMPRHQSQGIVRLQIQWLIIGNAVQIQRGFIILRFLEYFKNINNFLSMPRTLFFAHIQLNNYLIRSKNI